METRKQYTSPSVASVRVDSESLLTAMSCEGTVSGPVGVREMEDWEEE